MIERDRDQVRDLALSARTPRQVGQAAIALERWLAEPPEDRTFLYRAGLALEMRRADLQEREGRPDVLREAWRRKHPRGEA